MYELLLSKIATTLGNVDRVKSVYAIPKSKITRYPAVFYKPNGLVNSFETNNENLATYAFVLVVIVGAEQKSLNSIFTTVLPKTVDAIINQFDEEWNQGTTDGHRITAKIDSADAWEVSEEQDGLVAYAPLFLEVRLLTNN